MRELIRHRQPVIHNITPNQGNRRWLKRARLTLPEVDCSGPPLEAFGDAQWFLEEGVPASIDAGEFFLNEVCPCTYLTSGVLPLGITFSNGVYSGTPEPGTSLGSPYNITITASDQCYSGVESVVAFYVQVP